MYYDRFCSLINVIFFALMLLACEQNSRLHPVHKINGTGSPFRLYIVDMEQVRIFSYLDYRSFLKDSFELLRIKSPSFSYRNIAAKLGYKSIGHITWILQGKRNLTLKNADKFSSLLALNKKEDAYFKLLVCYTNAKKHLDKKDYFEKLVSAQKSEQRVVSREQIEYWSKWYYSAMREVVAIHRISDDYKEASKLLVPRISPVEAEKALKLLEQLGFIAKDKQGFFRRVDKVISTNPEWGSLAVRQHQMDMLDLAKQGLENIPREERDISSITMSLSLERFEQVRAMMQDFRQKLITLARTDSNPERVFQVGLQVFPLSKLPGGANEE